MEAILDIKVLVPPAFSTSEYYNPMLVMFLCILDDNKCLDFSDSSNDKKDAVSLCDLCLRLVMFLSKKSADAICESVRSFGRIVLESLQYGRLVSYQVNDPLLQKVLHHNQCGSVTFVHSSLQFFLGALYFLLKIDDGNNIDMMLGQNCTILMMNPLFLYFCLSLLKNQTDHILLNREKVDRALRSFMARKMNSVQVDLTGIAEIYPSVKYAYTSKTKDELVLEFLNDSLSECQKTNILLLSHNFHVQEILSSFPNLTSVMFVNTNEIIDSDILQNSISESDTSELKVVLQNQPDELISKLLHFLNERNKQFSLHFLRGDLNKPRMELPTFTQGEITKLHIQHLVGSCYQSYLRAKHDLPVCRHLTHLFLTSSDLYMDDSVFRALSEAVREGKLPKLSHLSLRKLQSYEKFPPLSLLFQTQWQALTHLDLTGCVLDKNDIQIVFGATDPTHTNQIPNLSSLAISSSYFKKSGSLFAQPWLSLSSLKFNETDS